MKKSYGFVEVHGLALAIVVADAMVKSANVELVGTEHANGIAWLQVKVKGDVGAVTSAVDIGSDLAKKHHGFVACRVIARPDAELVSLLNKSVDNNPVSQPQPVESTPVSVDKVAQEQEVKASTAQESTTEKHSLAEPSSPTVLTEIAPVTNEPKPEPKISVVAKSDKKKNATNRKRSNK